MTNRQHTPGPWSFDTDLDGTLRSETSVPICQIIEHNQSEANARLIAAAPDMLKALQDIAETSRDDSARIIAESAIAKATK